MTERIQGAWRGLLQVGIPGFFYIAGCAVTYHNTAKKTFCTFFKDKCMRLLLPLIVAILLFLIPRLYF